jgi:ABC-2 type transport system ATP-binding protein
VSAGSSAPAVAARGVVKHFRDRHGGVVRAVDGLDLLVPLGQIVAFLGPNGAGKTTTLDMVLGLTTPDSGTVIVAGMAPRTAVRAGKISAVLQTGGLLNDLTVSETVRLVASTFEKPRPVADVVARAGIGGIADRRVSKCSGGEQQRLRFALALLPDPDVLILDEPTAGMDVAARQEFWTTMRADVRAGRTVIFATHYLEEADAFAERIVLMSHGRVVADGSTSEIRAKGAGRTLSVEIPQQGADDWLRRARAAAGLLLVETRGHRAYFTADDTDAAALTLLTGLGARGLEIAAPTLDSAFVALTGGGTGAVDGTDDGGVRA